MSPGIEEKTRYSIFLSGGFPWRMGRRRASTYRNDCVARRLFPPIYEHPGATVYSWRPHLYISYIHLFSFPFFFLSLLPFQRRFLLLFLFSKKKEGGKKIRRDRSLIYVHKRANVVVTPRGTYRPRWLKHDRIQREKQNGKKFVQGWCHQIDGEREREKFQELATPTRIV